jgi:hypothetical protein
MYMSCACPVQANRLKAYFAALIVSRKYVFQDTSLLDSDGEKRQDAL